MSIPLLLLALLVCTANIKAQTPNVTGPPPQYQFKRNDVAEPVKPISFDLPITCTAQKIAVAGYGMDGFPRGYAGVNDPNSQKGLYEDVHVMVDAKPTNWKITVHGDKADVLISGQSSTDITETWIVASKTDEYLILMRIWGNQISTITINAKYATFVHCFNGEFFFVNHGAISWGTCSN
jgi:hypothetical protein